MCLFFKNLNSSVTNHLLAGSLPKWLDQAAGTSPQFHPSLPYGKGPSTLPFSAFFPGIFTGKLNGKDIQTGTPIWDAVVAVGGLTHCTIMPTPTF